MMNWYKYLLTLIFNIVNPEECTYKRIYKNPNNESLDKANVYLPEGYKLYFEILFVVIGCEGELEGEAWILCHICRRVYSLIT